MKSIIQEGSSISKAIELAWEKADKPKEFSIKVFEEAQKNFIGMTIKSAKIAFLFAEETGTKNSSQKTKKVDHKKKHLKIEDNSLLKSVEKKIEKKIKKEKKIVEPEQKNQQIKTPKKVIWNNEMIEIAQEWVQNLLKIIKKDNVTFSTKTSRYHLKFHFNKSLEKDDNQQKNMFRNIAFLAMQAIRNKYKKQFKYHKIVLTSE